MLVRVLSQPISPSILMIRQPVVEYSYYSRDFHFPLRNNVKISEHAPNFNVFKARLVCRRIFILPSGSSGKNFRFFHQFATYAEFGDWTEIPKNLKFSKKSEILVFEKISQKLFQFFCLIKWKTLYHPWEVY